MYIVNTLKDGDEIPEFYIKHIKHVKSPGFRSNVSSLISEGYILGKASITSSILGAHTHSSHIHDLSMQTTSTLSEDTAVAIYEYAAQREDEFDVTIGDQFVIIARETGWYIVEKAGHRGWVPAGCLLESNDPSTEHIGATNGIYPIGNVLFDYQQNSPNELTIHKGDSVTIHKKYQHWLLVDYRDQHGWVPSCYISIRQSLNSIQETTENVN